MSKPKRDFKATYEELMRKAGEARQYHAARALELERANRRELQRIRSREAQRLDEIKRTAIARIDKEIESLAAKIAVTGDTEESIMLKAELAHLQTLRERFAGEGRRRPPESGIVVPAVPPRGPLPKQGGAAAALDFGD